MATHAELTLLRCGQTQENIWNYVITYVSSFFNPKNAATAQEGRSLADLRGLRTRQTKTRHSCDILGKCGDPEKYLRYNQDLFSTEH